MIQIVHSTVLKGRVRGGCQENMKWAGEPWAGRMNKTDNWKWQQQEEIKSKVQGTPHGKTAS